MELVKTLRELGRAPYKELLELRTAVDQEIDYRKRTYDAIEHKCSICGFTDEEFPKVYIHMHTKHSLNNHEILRQMERYYP